MMLINIMSIYNNIDNNIRETGKLYRLFNWLLQFTVIEVPLFYVVSFHPYVSQISLVSVTDTL